MNSYTLRQVWRQLLLLMSDTLHSRVQNKSREYFGEATARDLVAWLNSDPDGELVELVEAAQLGQKKTINSILKKYQFTYQIARMGGAWEIVQHVRTPSHDQGECAVYVLAFIELAKYGLLPQLKRCANAQCRRWFFARFAHQEYHKKECKSEAYEADPARKEARKKWMRQYYRKNFAKT
jgi:hypothetical protein